MTATLAHRGPDESGTWQDDRIGIALGHRRLSILDLSTEGRQPMVSGQGRYVIVFNGEIYNFGALRVELERLVQPPPIYRGSSDTEVMLACFEHWGIAGSVARFNGMFAFAVWDRQERNLYLARDRMGEKPLYYAWVGQDFLFGSELKALRFHPGFRNPIDRSALTLFMRHGYVPAPHSIYEGVWKLPAATILTVASGDRTASARPVPYWSAIDVAQSGCQRNQEWSDSDAEAGLESLLSDSVKLRMISDVPLGAFLSGGVDSSTIVALMQKHSRRPVRTFTIGFEDKGCDEAPHAAAVARHLGTDHTELYVTAAQARSTIPELPVLYDEPFADSSQIPTLLVSRLARRHVTVALSGDGGDEVFGGYTRYLWAASVRERLETVPDKLRHVLARLLKSIPPDRWDSLFDIFGRLLPKRLRLATPGLKLEKLSRIAPLRDSALIYLELVSQWSDPHSIVVGGSPTSQHLIHGDHWSALPGFVETMMLADMVTYLPDDILVKVDRASMGVSLESRVPFLDHRLVEFSWRLPLHMKIRQGRSKWLLRRMLSRYVPDTLIDRPKLGFGVPLDQWLRDPLRDWAEELLGSDRLRREGFLNPGPIRQKWLEHKSGRHNRMTQLWNVLMFQSWLAEQSSPRGVNSVSCNIAL